MEKNHSDNECNTCESDLSQAMLLKVISKVRDHLSVVGLDYRYKAVNDAYLNAHLLAREQIIGKSVSELLGEEKFETLVRPNLDRCFAGEEVNYRGYFDFNGYDERKYMDVTYIPNFEDGKITAAIVSVHDITRFKKAEEKLAEVANIDALTELPNRRFIERELNKAIASAERSQSTFAIVFCDLNKFKDINDNFDHNTGDIVLGTVARRLSLVIRTDEDVGRWGGDEFIVITRTNDSSSAVESIKKRIRIVMGAPVIVDQAPQEIGISLGHAIFPADGKDIETLLKTADDRMYSQKSLGNH